MFLRNLLIFSFVLLAVFSNITVTAQCNTGEVEVSLTILTDDYGNEVYWQLVPHNNTCGIGVIASGGNNAVGCSGGNAQQSPNGGYGSNSNFSAGPWCLTEGASYDLLMIDDWDDGANHFGIVINGYHMYDYTTHGGTGGEEVFTFTASPPLAYNLGVTSVTTPHYIFGGMHPVTGRLKNFSADTIHALTLNYSINNGTTVSSNLSGLSIAPFTNYDFIHPAAWSTPDTGAFLLKVWASNPDGHADMDLTNDESSTSIIVLPTVPELIDQYLSITPVFTTIADAGDHIDVPRDLDFHPDLRRYELWTILKGTEMSGGSTVTIYNAGKTNQASVLKTDGNSHHFMSMPTAIAFSDNENFATAPGVYDANHDGGSPFTGPTLWSSDTMIYCKPNAGNGSHIDMLHQSPYSMGVCHESENAFWVMDGDAGNVVRYDFKIPHEPGGSNHSDGTIRRFPDVTFQPDPAYHVPSHCVLDKNNGQLYMVDFGGRRVLKMDIATGTPGISHIPYEATAEYLDYDNPVYSTVIDTGLIQPCGIEIFKNRLLLSDFANGDIRIYNISNNNISYLGRITTGAGGIMGVKIGPDGKIWYVNATQNKVIRIDGTFQNSNTLVCDSFCVVRIEYDTATTGYLNVTLTNNDTNFISYPIVQVINANGDTVGNPLGGFDFFGQNPNTTQTYHIATSLDSFPINFGGTIRLEDGLYHNSCLIGFCGAPIVSAIKTQGDDYVQIQPNPVRDRFSIRTKTLFADANITLYDLQGRKLKGWHSDGQNIINLSLPPGIAGGIYLLNLNSVNFEKTFKIQVE